MKPSIITFADVLTYKKKNDSIGKPCCLLYGGGSDLELPLEGSSVSAFN